MNEETLKLFKTLTELPGAPGNEHAVRKFMREELEKYSDEIIQDHLGGIFGLKKSDDDNAPK
ncbi:peptidase M28, partial [Butyricicoccus sp. 1XD8-22]